MDKDQRQLELDLQMPKKNHEVYWYNGSKSWLSQLNSYNYWNTTGTNISQTIDWYRWTT